MRVESIFDRDVDRSMKVKSVDLGGISRKGSREEEFLTL